MRCGDTRQSLAFCEPISTGSQTKDTKARVTQSQSWQDVWNQWDRPIWSLAGALSDHMWQARIIYPSDPSNHGDLSPIASCPYHMFPPNDYAMSLLHALPPLLPMASFVSFGAPLTAATYKCVSFFLLLDRKSVV